MSMKMFCCGVGALFLALAGPPAMAENNATPLIIAHRGASADRPEHTLAAYRLAIAQGADFIEPDLVSTRDGHLVARHENAIGDTTDVAQRPEFANRLTTKTIDGQQITDWFTEDFTLAELKTLRARERLPQIRPDSARFDLQDEIPTLEEIIALIAAEEKRLGRRIGIYPETKHPAYFRSIGLPLEERLLSVLAAHGYDSAEDPVFIQSFEVGNLQRLRQETKVRLIQLMAGSAGPPDRPDMRYGEMATREGLAAIARYADGVGLERAMVIPRQPDGRLATPSDVVELAHEAGLKVHVWTFRPENIFLPPELRKGDTAAERGDGVAEIRAFLATGIDGFFTDSTPTGKAAVGERKE